MDPRILESIFRIHRVAAKSLPPPEIAVEDGIFVIRLRNGRPDGGAAAEPAFAWPNRPPRAIPDGDGS